MVLLVTVLLILGLVNVFFPEQSVVHWFLYAAGTVFMALVTFFFRFPRRTATQDPQKIYSAADGRVVAIEKVLETEYFQQEMTQVSVFMFPLDVHVNWTPVSGKIMYQKYHPGRHYPAYKPKSSLENEMYTTVIKDDRGKYTMIRQIAGIMARRILCEKAVSDTVAQAEYLGLIKFGSRVDLFFACDADVKVKLGQRVRACHDVIAEYS